MIPAADVPNGNGDDVAIGISRRLLLFRLTTAWVNPAFEADEIPFPLLDKPPPAPEDEMPDGCGRRGKRSSC